MSWVQVKTIGTLAATLWPAFTVATKVLRSVADVAKIKMSGAPLTVTLDL